MSETEVLEILFSIEKLGITIKYFKYLQSYINAHWETIEIAVQGK